MLHSISLKKTNCIVFYLFNIIICFILYKLNKEKCIFFVKWFYYKIFQLKRDWMKCCFTNFLLNNEIAKSDFVKWKWWEGDFGINLEAQRGYKKDG